MTTKSEQLSLSSSIVIVGPSGSGKEWLARTLASMLGMHALITGRSIRGASLKAHEEKLFEYGRGDHLRLRPGAESRITDWIEDGNRGLHFVTLPPADPIAHIFFGKDDLTNVLRPRYNGSKEHRDIERGAGVIAANSNLRESFFEPWRQTIIRLGGTLTVAKTPEKFIPEAHAVIALHTDETTAAGYRILNSVAAYESLDDEREYLLARNGLHASNGLDGVPKGALVIDTTNVLMVRDGMNDVANRVLGHLRQKFPQRPMETEA